VAECERRERQMVKRRTNDHHRTGGVCVNVKRNQNIRDKKGKLSRNMNSLNETGVES